MFYGVMGSREHQLNASWNRTRSILADFAMVNGENGQVYFWTHTDFRGWILGKPKMRPCFDTICAIINHLDGHLFTH